MYFVGECVTFTALVVQLYHQCELSGHERAQMCQVTLNITTRKYLFINHGD